MPLSYAPRPSRRAWRLIRRLALWIVLAGLLIGGVIFALCLVDGIHDYRLQDAFSNYTWPAGSIAYADRPIPATSSLQPTVLPGSKTMDAWLAPMLGNMAPDYITVFLHARRVPGGPDRLIRLACISRNQQFEGGDRLTFVFHVFEHAPLYRLMSRAMSGMIVNAGDSILVIPGAAQGITLHGGEADPANPRHFTIAYECAGRSGIIDGWLEPDDELKLERRP